MTFPGIHVPCLHLMFTPFLSNFWGSHNSKPRWKLCRYLNYFDLEFSVEYQTDDYATLT
jgi:hypothetical protein